MEGDNRRLPIEFSRLRPDRRVHDRGPRLDVQLAERMAKLVDPQQTPPVVSLVEVSVEKHRARLDRALGILRPSSVADRPRKRLDAVVTPDDDGARAHDGG